MTNERELRAAIADSARELQAAGLVIGTSGNLSARLPGSDRLLITPSGVEYARLEPDAIVVVDLDGRPVGDGLKPSVDTPNHAAIYRARPDVGGVVHTHSPHATAFSVVHAPIPALVAEAAGYLGGPVRVLDDVQPARPDQADRVAGGLGDDRAVLLPNHGVIAVGETLRGAFDAAALVEHSARVAWLARSLGPAHEVPEDEIRRLHDFLHREYGQR